MTPELQVTLLWIAFAATHIGLSSIRFRGRLMERLGPVAFRGLYSLVAFAIFIPLMSIYFGARHLGEPVFFAPRTPAFYYSIYVVMGIAFLFAVAGILQPSPASITARAGADRVFGIARITRHPLMMGLALFALAHLVIGGQPIDLCFFGGFFLFSVGGAWHQDRRLIAENERFATFAQETPFIPFAGKGRLLGLRELSIWVWIVGLGSAFVVRNFLHPWA